MEMVHLIGAEQVQSAGRMIQEAANGMQRSASTIDEALRQHQRFLDQWLDQFTAALRESLPPAKREGS